MAIDVGWPAPTTALICMHGTLSTRTCDEAAMLHFARLIPAHMPIQQYAGKPRVALVQSKC